MTSLSTGQPPVRAAGEELVSAERLAALRQAGLTAAPDEAMERFARLVASMLRVPVALVSLVEADRQVFPGMVGLAEPWATTRQTPLSHSLCQHVATSGSPLILPDARLDERTCASLAIPDLGVVAYAGMPLTDGAGHVLGSLCAIDERPRAWTGQELADLADLAAACSGELRLRITSEHARQAQAQVTVAFERARLLLRSAEDLGGAVSLVDVRRSVRSLVSTDLRPSYVGLILLDQDQLRRVPDPDICYVADIHTAVFPLTSAFPSAQAARQGEIVAVSDRAGMRARYGPDVVAEFAAAGLQAAVCVPLPGTRRTLGVLVLGWAAPHQLDVTEEAVLTAIAGYTAQAIERALHLDDRITVARQLQQAMLTELPDVGGLELAAAYHPAAAGELVGGDWYDAYPLAAHGGPLAVTVGDITGHDMRAASVMGQVRSMLRQANLHGRPDPAEAVTAVENACARLSIEATGTLVHGRLDPVGDTGSWQLTWTNAGHPPPLLGRRGADTELLGDHDLLLWPGMPGGRADWQRVLHPGDTLLLYSDGLVEDRALGVDAGISRAARLLAAAPAGLPLPDLLSQLIEAAAANSADDMVLLAVRIPPARS